MDFVFSANALELVQKILSRVGHFSRRNYRHFLPNFWPISSHGCLVSGSI
jgi:hypothetical protein